MMLIHMAFDVVLEVPAMLFTMVVYHSQPTLGFSGHIIDIICPKKMAFKSQECLTVICISLGWPDIQPTVMFSC